MINSSSNIDLNNNKTIFIITVDGPVGSGKGTLSVMLSKHYGFYLLDSGALYRVLALAIKKNNIDVNNEQEIYNLATNLNIEFNINEVGTPAAVLLDNIDVSYDIRQEECGSLASKISKYNSVRQALLGLQRDFLKMPGLVADGRDMGTVVFPEADIKFYLTASQEVRAQRRYEQLLSKQKNSSFDDLLLEIKARDERDMNRSLAPLKPADDAIVIDSSDMDIQQVFDSMILNIDLRISQNV